MRLRVDLRLEDPNAHLDTVTLTTTEPATLGDQLRDAAGYVKRFGHLARFVALNRQLDRADVLPHHDTNPKGRIAPFWTWCACGQTHRLEHDCPRCGPQKPETD
jgi:hypothetical protein